MYNVLPEKRQVKSVRYMNQLISWFVFCPHSNIVVISMSKTTSSLFVFHLKNGTIYKLPKLEIDTQQIEVKEKDVVIFTNYNVVNYVAVVIHPEENAPAASSTSEIILYNINKDAVTVTKTHRLRTSFNGVSGLAMHTIDDVLVVHNKQEGETFFFDVGGGLSGEFDGTLSHHVSVGKPCRMTGQEYPNWVLFPPDIVIDPNAGTMSKIKLRIEALKVDEDFCGSLELPRHVSFMLQRQNAKRALLESLLACCVNPVEVDLTSLGTCFDRINREYRLFIDKKLAPNLALSASPFSSSSTASQSTAAAATPVVQSNLNQRPSKVILDQADIYTNIMSPLLEMATLDGSAITIKRVIAIVIEYLRSLEERQIPAQHFLHELLINLLVRSGQYYQLHQLLQYHIISDSKPLACLLLSLEGSYPAAFQLSMDMLSRYNTLAFQFQSVMHQKFLFRLKTSQEEIVEILLSKKKILSALMYAKSSGLERSVPAKKFLQSAKDTGDKSILQSARNWLQEQSLLSAKDAHDYEIK